jgi:hypothetical protein
MDREEFNRAVGKSAAGKGYCKNCGLNLYAEGDRSSGITIVVQARTAKQRKEDRTTHLSARAVTLCAPCAIELYQEIEELIEMKKA